MGKLELIAEARLALSATKLAAEVAIREATQKVTSAVLAANIAKDAALKVTQEQTALIVAAEARLQAALAS